MTTTGQNWVDKTRGHLLSGFQEERNTLNGSYTAGGTTITLTYALGGIRQGARLCIGLNTFYVYSVSGQIATVVGGQDGSTDANAASGAVVRVNPRFTDNDVWLALADDLGDLSSPVNGLYGVGTVDLTYNAIATGYDLGSIASSFLDIYEIKYLTPGPSKDNPRIHNGRYHLNRNANTTQFASGFGLQLSQPGYPGYNLRVVYKSTFVTPATLASDVATSGLQTSAFDLPPIGAALRLMAGREIKRNFTESQGDTRRATEVPPGAINQSSTGLTRLRQARITAEASRLEQLYPSSRY